MAGPPPPYELLHDQARGCTLLLQTHTEEAILLPPGQWRLEEHEGQFGVSCHDAFRWCESEFGQVVVEHPETQELTVVFDGGKQQSLTRFQQEHESLEIAFQGSCADAFHLNVILLKHAVSGNQLLFSLPSLYAHALGKGAKMTVSAWYQSWWPWWVKILEQHALDQRHLRKPMPRLSKGQTNTDHSRFLDVATVSAHALLILLTKWSSPTRSGRQKDDGNRQAWSTVHHSVLSKAFPAGQATAIPVFIDTSTAVRSGCPLVGANLVTLGVCGLEVDVYPLLMSEAPFMPVTIECIRQLPLRNGHFVDMDALLRHLEQAGRAHFWLFRQLLHGCSLQLTGKLLEVIQQSRTGQSQTQAEAPGPHTNHPEALLQSRKSTQSDKRMQQHSRRFHVVGYKTWSRDKAILKHFYALREFFDKQHVTVAFDASRIGGQERMIGIISNSDRTAWLPPQAT